MTAQVLGHLTFLSQLARATMSGIASFSREIAPPKSQFASMSEPCPPAEDTLV